MNVIDLPDERVLDVRFEGASLIVDLMDGRTIPAPLAWYPRLLHATPEQRAKWEKAGARAMAFTGPRLTRISARKACFAVRLRPSWLS